MASRGEQLPLPVDDQVRAPLRESGNLILSTCRDVTRAAGKLDVVAGDAGLDPAQLSRALNAKGYHLGVTTLPAFFRHDRDRTLIRLLCRLAGGRFEEAPPVMTPEEELAAYKRVLAERYGTLADQVKAAVHGESAP